jgi:hypothetical protein
MPVQGSYGALRWFAEQAMASMPYASLDEVVLKRDGVASDELEGKLQLTLFVTSSSASMSPLRSQP